MLALQGIIVHMRDDSLESRQDGSDRLQLTRNEIMEMLLNTRASECRKSLVGAFYSLGRSHGSARPANIPACLSITTATSTE